MPTTRPTLPDRHRRRQQRRPPPAADVEHPLADLQGGRLHQAGAERGEEGDDGVVGGGRPPEDGGHLVGVERSESGLLPTSEADGLAMPRSAQGTVTRSTVRWARTVKPPRAASGAVRAGSCRRGPRRGRGRSTGPGRCPGSRPTRVKRSKTVASWSAGSRGRSRRRRSRTARRPPWSRPRATVPPAGVWRTALDSRLARTWPMRVGSTSISGRPSATVDSSRDPLAGGERGVALHRVGHQRRRVGPLGVQGQPAGVGQGQGVEVVDQAARAPGSPPAASRGDGRRGGGCRRSGPRCRSGGRPGACAARG